MTNFRKQFPFKQSEFDNRVSICEQRIDMLEDELTNLEQTTQSLISSILKLIKNN